MALKLGYRDGGKTSEEGINRIGGRQLSAAGVFHDGDLQVVATGTPDNKVNISTGDVAIGNNTPNTADPDYFYHGWVTASNPLTVSANASGNPRIDAVVAYVDLAVVSSVSNDNPGALATKIVAGTPAASPVAPDDTAIQASVGASNPWIPLALVAVANGFATITNANITDTRPKTTTPGRLADAEQRDFVGGGLLWSLSSGLVGQMTTGWAVINGEIVNKSYLLHTFTASKDTYVDLPLSSKPTSLDDLTYTAVNNGVASPALAANSIRLAKVVTSGAAITSVTSSGDDTLGNPIKLGKPAYTHTHGSNSEGGQLDQGAFATRVDPVQRHLDTMYDYVVSGCVWSGDSYGATLNASMTSGVCYILGKRLTVAAVTARAFTASRDTYVYLTDNGDGTAAFTYTANTNNTASPAAPANSILVAIIVSGATFITNVGSINQGQLSKVLPIVSSVPYQVTDSNGNLICNRDPKAQLIGYRQRATNLNVTSTSIAAVAELSAPVLITDATRKYKITLRCGQSASNSGGMDEFIGACDGTVSVPNIICFGNSSHSGSGFGTSPNANNLVELSAGLHTINGFFYVNTSQANTTNGATQPMYLSIERE